METAQGMVPRYLHDLHEGGLKGVDIANIADVSKATVSRWRQGAANPQVSAQLVLSDLHYVVGRLREYYTPDEIRVWLYSPHPQLEGEREGEFKRAVDVIAQGRSGDVLAVLDRLDAGAYI